MSKELYADSGYRAAAEVAVRDCLSVQPGETVLVVTDAPLRDVGQLLWETAKTAGADAILTEIMPRRQSAEEPPAPVAEAMKAAQVVFCPTSKSLSHTKARKAANDAGARVATLPGVQLETLLRAMSADYSKIAARSNAIAEVLTKGATAHLTTPAGTDLTMSIEGRTGYPDTGLCHEPGTFSNLPAGETFIAPVEGTANGTLVVDGTMGAGIISTPLRFEIKDGFVTKLLGGDGAERIQELLDRLGRDAGNIAELGIGTNDKARLCGSVLEDEKVMGTVHVAIGDNSTFGGHTRVASHQDGIMLKPTLVIDATTVLRDGVLLIEGE